MIGSEFRALGLALVIIVVGLWLWAEVDRWLARRRRERKRQQRLANDAIFDEAARRRAVERLRRGGW